MSMITQRTHFRLSPLANGAGDARRTLAGHGWSRRLLWFVAGSALVLMGLLAPALVNRQPVEAPAVRLSQQSAGAAQVSLRTSSTTSGSPQHQTQRQTLAGFASASAPPTAIPSAPAMLGADAEAATSRKGDRLFLPLVVRTQSQAARLLGLSSTQGNHWVTGQLTPNAERALSAAAATDHRLFLATVMRVDGAASLPATIAVSTANQATSTETDRALFLPLVANTLDPVAVLTTIQPQPPVNAIAIPTTMPTPVPTAPPPTPPAPPVFPVFTPPTPASAQAQQAQAQLQALQDEVNELLERGVLPAAEGQPLLRQIRVVMRLPIFTLGVAPSAPSPGQPQPEVQQLQLFTDHLEQLVAGGQLPADQGQSLLDQARAISHALGGG